MRSILRTGNSVDPTHMNKIAQEVFQVRHSILEGRFHDHNGHILLVLLKSLAKSVVKARVENWLTIAMRDIVRELWVLVFLMIDHEMLLPGDPNNLGLMLIHVLSSLDAEAIALFRQGKYSMSSRRVQSMLEPLPLPTPLKKRPMNKVSQNVTRSPSWTDEEAKSEKQWDPFCIAGPVDDGELACCDPNQPQICECQQKSSIPVRSVRVTMRQGRVVDVRKLPLI